jgi:hypothetical protein
MMFDVTDPALRQLGDSGREWTRRQAPCCPRFVLSFPAVEQQRKRFCIA